MKIWSTRYVLTHGITEHEVRETHSPSMVLIIEDGQSLHGEGRDWHRSLDGAKVRAEEVSRNKIASLRKSIAKLEAMQFDA